ncbi:hypothetical protein FRC04_001208 [Tulasnella sp. 424]|nr:hypothetical protein FRC04_001208 [Tulasnella sp. 424]
MAQPKAEREDVVAKVVEVPETVEEAEDVEDKELELELDDDDEDEDDPVDSVCLNDVIVHVPLHTLVESPAHALSHDELLGVVPGALTEVYEDEEELVEAAEELALVLVMEEVEEAEEEVDRRERRMSSRRLGQAENDVDVSRSGELCGVAC